MLEDHEFQWSSNYTGVKVPLLEAYNPSSEEIVTEAKRGNRLRLIPACTVGPDKDHIKIRVNKKALEEVADFPAEFTICPGSGDQPHFYATFKRDFDLSKLDYLIEILAYA